MAQQAPDKWLKYLIGQPESMAKVYESAFRAARSLSRMSLIGLSRLRHENRFRLEAVVDGMDAGLSAGQEGPVEHFLEASVLESRQPLAVPDLQSDEQLRYHHLVLRYGVHAYLGVPVLQADGGIYGVLWTADEVPRPEVANMVIPLQVAAGWLGLWQDLHRTRRDLRSKSDQVRDLVSQLKMANQGLEMASVRDLATGLFNARHFEEMLRNELSRCARYGFALTVLMVRPYETNSITDLGGREALDSVLQTVGAVVKKGLRVIDVAARYSDDIIAVLLPQTDAVGARTVVERILGTVAACEISAPGLAPGSKVTINMGMRQVAAGVRESDQAVLREARDALTDAAELGGDRVVLHGQEG